MCYHCCPNYVILSTYNSVILSTYNSVILSTYNSVILRSPYNSVILRSTYNSVILSTAGAKDLDSSVAPLPQNDDVTRCASLFLWSSS